MPAPIRVAVTVQQVKICYSLLFRIASGEMFGLNQPVILHLLSSCRSRAKGPGRRRHGTRRLCLPAAPGHCLHR